MKTAIFFATFEEAEPFLKLSGAEAIPNKKGLYEWRKGLVILSGIGPFAAFTSGLDIRCDFIYNFGLAGAPSKSYTLGSLHPITLVSKRQWHPKGTGKAQESASSSFCSDIRLAEQGATLVTCDQPIYDTNGISADLVDMEGYAIALLAKLSNTPCALYKIVSDYCDEKSFSMIRQNLAKYSLLLAEHAMFLLDKKR